MASKKEWPKDFEDFSTKTAAEVDKHHSPEYIADREAWTKDVAAKAAELRKKNG